MDTTPRSRPTATPPTASAPSLVSEVDPVTAEFLATVRETYRTALPSDVASSHLRMILAEAAVSPAPPTLRDRWARHARRVAAVGAVKIALTATAAAAATGTGLAATGSLPDAAQTVVAGIAEQIGLTLPVPAAETPGDRTDADGNAKPGIGEGGVPGLLESGADDSDLPGRAGDAPAFDRDADGRPVAPAQDGRETTDDRRNTGGEDRGEDRAEQRPAAPAPEGKPDTAGDTTTDETTASDTPAADTPAAERPEPPASQPVPPAGGTAPEDAGDDEAPRGGRQADATDD